MNNNKAFLSEQTTTKDVERPLPVEDEGRNSFWNRLNFVEDQKIAREMFIQLMIPIKEMLSQSPVECAIDDKNHPDIYSLILRKIKIPVGTSFDISRFFECINQEHVQNIHFSKYVADEDGGRVSFLLEVSLFYKHVDKIIRESLAISYHYIKYRETLASQIIDAYSDVMARKQEPVPEADLPLLSKFCEKFYNIRLSMPKLETFLEYIPSTKIYKITFAGLDLIYAHELSYLKKEYYPKLLHIFVDYSENDGMSIIFELCNDDSFNLTNTRKRKLTLNDDELEKILPLKKVSRLF